jgi:GntR family transcriptional regulator
MPAKPKWAQIADDIREKIASGEAAPGDKLPSISELRKQYGVSAAVVNHAMIVLKTEGLVEGVHGLGTFVAERPE